jgi:hypothetical protein
MAGYSIDLKINKKFEKEIESFLEFIRKVGKKYPVRISYKKVNNEEYYVEIDGTPGGKIDALYQELIINKALYYYGCSLKNRIEIINKVICPIYLQFLFSRFENSHERLLKKHILGKITDNFIPGDFYNKFSHKYELLFRKWDIKIISNYDFVKDLDDLLTSFLLDRLGHEKGDKSSRFDILVKRVSVLGPVMEKDTTKIFQKVHKLRTNGLHRLERELEVDDISNIASHIYWFFQYYDKFDNSQKEKTTKLHGKFFRRIKYGGEKFYQDGKLLDFDTDIPCHDCGAVKGQFHSDGCDMEQCSRCKGQYLGCSCKLDSDFD